MEEFADYISELARKALLFEVYTTPKPGLVDRNNNGAHLDMDVALFEKSADALTPYFSRCVLTGAECVEKPKDELLKYLRPIGIQAEKDMFEATGGINTHKGIIFSMGILCGAVGYQYARGEFLNIEGIWKLVAEMGHSAVKSDLSKLESFDGATSGMKQYLKYGMQGIRGEVALGIPSVRLVALAQFEKFKQQGDTLNDTGCKILLFLMGEVDDSNVISRSNRACGQFIKETLREYLSQTDTISLKFIKQLDNLFIKWNLSPGGCADLLAITYFVYLLKNEENLSIEIFLSENNVKRQQEKMRIQKEERVHHIDEQLLYKLQMGLTKFNI